MFSNKPAQEEDIRAKKIIIHEQYIWPKDNDIALIVLSKKVSLKDRVQVACLPMTDNPTVPQTNYDDQKMAECYTTGWGYINNDKKRANILQELEVSSKLVLNFRTESSCKCKSNSNTAQSNH